MNEEKFTGKADKYDKYRPSYPKELADILYEKTSARTVADIGAGTGKFTSLLALKPWDIIAVEPNSDMLGKFKENLPEIPIINAPAENTGIDSRSVELVTAATAFHWFDEEKFKEECRRILTPEGRLAVVFNEKVTDELVKMRDEISRIYCGYKGHAGKLSPEEGADFLRYKYFSEVEYFEYEHSMTYNKEGFIGNTLSRSYSLKEGDAGYEDYVNELCRLFEKFGSSGYVELKYKASCYLGKL